MTATSMTEPSPQESPLASPMAVDRFLSDVCSSQAHLVAIHPDRRDDIIAEDHGEHIGGAARWAATMNDAGYGIYFSVNAVTPGQKKKASKTDITAVRYCHVDVDGTQDPTPLLNAGANVVIASGGGFNALWCLEPGTTIEQVEDINRRIAHALGGDHTWNVDRVLRVSGTVNHPNAIKRARGRVPALATLIHVDMSRVWTVAELLAKFPPVLERPEDDGPDEYDPGDWEPIALDELDPPPRGTLAVLLDYVPPVGERSEHVVECVRALARSGYPASVIMGLLMDPRNPGLNEHIADQGSYAKQLRQARRKLALGEAVRRDVAAELARQVFTLPTGAIEYRRDVFRASDWDGREVPVRKWIVEGLIPDRTVTDLSADGGTGKSLLAMQLAVAAVTGRQWLKHNVTPGRVLYFSAEDESDELQRRLVDITRAEGIPMAALHDLMIMDRAGLDALLAVANGKVLQPTILAERLECHVAQHRPKLIVLDTRADVFGGNELDRTHVRQFVSNLRGACLKYDCAVLLISHPSLTGIASGSGQSGSTAWGNSVRSRLYLERPDSKDPDARVLTTKKANYGPLGADVRLRWQNGVFAVTFMVEPGPEGAAKEAERVDAKFLELLGKCNSLCQNVSPRPTANNYGPTMFANHSEAEGIRKEAFVAALARVTGDGRAKIIEEGPKSRKTTRLIL